MNTFSLGRSLVIFAILVPLAVLLGYLIATPDSFMALAVVGLTLMVLALPVVLRWHHVLLIVSWNAYVNVFFLPGQPQLWLFLAVVSLGISILKRALNPEYRFIFVPSVAWPLIFLALVVIGTAFARGGIGIRAFGGSSYGGKGYIYLLGAVLGFFAITAQRIPKHRAHLILSLFFLSSLTAVASNIAYAAGPKFYFLLNLFPVELVTHQFFSDQAAGGQVIQRISGLAPAAIGVTCFLLLRFGLRGTLNIKHPWRLVLLVSMFAAGLFAGFRSAVIIPVVLMTVLFFLEGLHRTRVLPILLLAGILAGAALIPFASKLPISVQRSLTFLPIQLDEFAQKDAASSSDWRVQMWQVLIPQIPQYLMLGKGYSIDPAALYLAEEGIRRGLFENYEGALLAGDYHSGPLSLIIPFGVWGAIGFLWFLAAGFCALYRNYRFGDPALKNLNRFLFAFFLIKTLLFFILYGAFSSELFIFTGIVGLSLALNGGVQHKPFQVNQTSRSVASLRESST